MDVPTSAGEPLRLNLRQLIIQRFQGDPQLSGCLRLVAVMLVEDAQDHLFFHLPERSGCGFCGSRGRLGCRVAAAVAVPRRISRLTATALDGAWQIIRTNGLTI